ncbi:GAF domain-containing protein [Mycolicibacterium arseniciresistens]|uniref:GAF domain-containing protein n=1 Tax=Mycolicibacterium arseniciresistens TaxID=3062257 RepID=A0ABT8UQN2_9MYCO|nr:GAF domain-containing protein [Mycolicibacterium arseniciresistens]MDO3638489.1 GAF domain-containing protein [Mycolicibacterium arseniciresistens]
MRSRRDDLDPQAALDRAFSLSRCGFGGVLTPAPADLEAAVTLAAEQHDERLARRIERFAAVDEGSFVWTRDGDGLFRLGRITGPYRYDGAAEAAAVDLVHVRACRWVDAPLSEPAVPPAVIATFERGGRNFQRTHDAGVAVQTQRIWDRANA